jgi:uncharacterized iron-regulated membrane protein
MQGATLARWLHLGHRWLGMALGWLVLCWFVSGIVMLFVARPQLTEQERLAALPAIAADSVKLPPLAAWRSLRLPGWPEAVRLDAESGRPAYRFLNGGQWSAVHADDGSPITGIDRDTATRSALRFAGSGTVDTANPVDVDQWTVYRSYDAWRPFIRIELADGRDIYVSQRDGAVVLDTSRSERLWNYMGSVVHWLYFTPLRMQQTLWRNTVLCASFIALLLAVGGVWLGWRRLRWKRRYPGGRLTPYRSGWKRHHHILGLCGGLFVLTWLLSGWLSLAPFGLASGNGLSREDARRLAGGVLTPETLHALPRIDADTRSAEWLLFAGKTLIRQHKGDGTSSLSGINTAPTSALTRADIEAAAPALRPGVGFESDWLTAADEHYYPLRHSPREFPVLRLRFVDAEHSTFYIAPATGRIAHYHDRRDTAHRWLFQALHRFDLAPLVANPTLRDGIIITLSLLGFGLTLAGVMLAGRRLSVKRRG